ncbi:MAG: AAA family ATPase [Thermoleophilia bacterium]
MPACPSCGKDLPDTFPFCPFCGAELIASARQVEDERKVVSVLFCDLVGFVATSEAADPEDVDRMLSAYAEMAQMRIEAYGGVVEKFIGDAVVGVFGVPATHEDDPERAVRAALRIVEDAEDLTAADGAPLLLRVGVNTAETLVRQGAIANIGERMLTGDVINTASRLQSVAPEMGVVVGVSTYEATRIVFEYEELEPAIVKGKPKAVRVFHAKSPRARFGSDLTRTHDSPFIGREIDLALLKGVFDKAVASESVQLVTIVGEPGLGKSRLVAEFSAYIDGRPELTTWREGRCLPYGEGITFWALGEILKAHTGILESDSSVVARKKLDAVLPKGQEREWFKQRLLPLLGIEASSSAEREELFTAWRRFLEEIADEYPAVLVFEDLHWADEAMLTFIEHLVDVAEGVPLLVIGTARPELYERHPDYATRLRNATPINLARLTDEEAARLVSTLLNTAVIPAALQKTIVERVGGNPFYVNEFVRLLRDRDLIVQKGSRWQLREGAEVPVPDSVQALIAARLDTLEPEAKALLTDAAVIGKVFWAGALTAMGERDPAEVTRMLRELSRKELVQPARHSSIEGEAEYAFWHALTRDVAYHQLPRASRVARHVAAAEWLEMKAPERLDDLADVLVYHYSTALELAQAAGHTDQAAELEVPALRFLRLAGERALGLDTVAALARFQQALVLTPQGRPLRAQALTRFAEAAFHAGRYVEAAEASEEAIGLFQAAGDVRAAAGAMGTLANALTPLGDARRWELPAEAVELMEPLGASAEFVGALTELARAETLQGHYTSGVGHADKALVLAQQLGLPRPARALGYKGTARCGLGDRGGIDDMRDAIAIATQSGQGREVGLLQNNLSVDLWAFEGPAAALQLVHEGLAFAQPRGLTEIIDELTAGMLNPLFDAGEHEQALELASQLEGQFETSGVTFLTQVRAAQILIYTLRGQAGEILGTLDWLETGSRDNDSPEYIVMNLAVVAFAHAALAHPDRAAALLTEIYQTSDIRNHNYAARLPLMTRTALTLGDPDLAQQLADGFQAITPYHEHALTAAAAALDEAHGNLQAAADGYADAARRWQTFGVLTEQAYAHLGHGRTLLTQGHTTQAGQPLHQARDIFTRLQATPALTETDQLLH